MPIVFGYSRASSPDIGDRDAHEKQLIEYGCDRIMLEDRRTPVGFRPKMRKAMALLEPNDMLVITSVDRFARDPADLFWLAKRIATKVLIWYPSATLASTRVDSGRRRSLPR